MLRPDIRMAQQMIRDGAIGTVLSVKCVSTHGGPEYFQYRDVDPSWFYQPGSGALFDMGVHGLHQVTGIMGPAVRVSCLAATAIKQRKVRSGAFHGQTIPSDKIADNYFISLDFGNDRIGFVDTGFCERATRSVPLEIFGDKGVISFDPPGSTWPNPKLYLDREEIGVRGWMEPQDWLMPHPRSFNQCCCLTDLVASIENDARPVLSAEHARHVIEIMCAIPKSMAAGAFIQLRTTF
jgi:predicted dehydrogenase